MVGGGWQQLAASNGTEGSPATSISDLALNNSTSGLYWFTIGGQTFETYVEFDGPNNENWMHIGTIVDKSETRSGSNQKWSSMYAPKTTPWDDGSTFGTQSFAEDFKSAGWNTVKFDRWLLRDLGSTKRNLFYTNIIRSNRDSLSDWFGGMNWTANASESSSSNYNTGHADRIHVNSYGVTDPCELGNKPTILIKFGEKDGVQDGNKDRSMIASHPYNVASNVDLPAGLGCFMSTSSTDKRYRDIVPYAQKQDAAPLTITGSPLEYSIWITEADQAALSEVLTRGNAGCYSGATWTRAHSTGLGGSMCNFADQRNGLSDVSGNWTYSGHQNSNGNSTSWLQVDLAASITAEYIALVGYNGGSHYPQHWKVQALVNGTWTDCFPFMTCAGGNDGTACNFYGDTHVNSWDYNDLNQGPDVYPERYKRFTSRVTASSWRLYYDGNSQVSNGYMLLMNILMWG
jgi:hypothetical protein